MLSVVIPTRGEIFLQETIDDLLSKARGDIEVIAVLDGPTPSIPVSKDPRLHIHQLPTALGMRGAINAGARLARGQYLMKTDGHCLFDIGFDQKLVADCDSNWVVIPRRYSLDAENWRLDSSRPVRDYHYLCYPDPHKSHDAGMHGVDWLARGKDRIDSQYDIDDTMSFQGSCWFMHKVWFDDFLGGMDENPIFSGWAQEPTEIGNKTWLGGGQVKVNKKTYYAHLHKGKRYGRGYKMNESGVIAGHNYAAEFWMQNRWPKAVHKIDWLVEKFWPVPTWPENWQDLYYSKQV